MSDQAQKEIQQGQKYFAEGTVLKTLPDASFEVELDSGETLIAYISGKMRHFRIRVVVGDRVKVERTPYDPNRGRIVERLD